VQRHLKHYHTPLIHDRDVASNEGKWDAGARQFLGDCQRMPSRFLHEIEFFPDIVSEDIAIRHMKEIARHGLDQPSDVLSRSKVATSQGCPC